MPFKHFAHYAKAVDTNMFTNYAKFTLRIVIFFLAKFEFKIISKLWWWVFDKF